ncbi:MAG: aminotransferase class V-fold PLP-dependent enzyme, partial [bacterium]|nr:aminotransferase class V-fold PLP-dependent enzyme [bacterium]
GLFGPPGTGGLYIAEEINFRPLKYGGTGSHSDLETMPEFLPDKYEAGTPNLPGIAGLKTGVEFILQTGLELIHRQELHLTQLFLEKVAELDEIQIYGSQDPFHRVATVSLNITGCDPLEVAQALQEVYGIICRPGLHCAPDAHKTIGTFPQGTLRFSFGYFNTREEIETLVLALRQIAQIKEPNHFLGIQETLNAVVSSQ